MRQPYEYPKLQVAGNDFLRRQEIKRVQHHLVRATTLGLSATLTIDEWMKTLEHFDGRCAFCVIGPYKVIEHFIPLEHGGGTTFSNCVPSCSSCNNSKKNIHPRTITGNNRMYEAIQRVQAYLQTIDR